MTLLMLNSLRKPRANQISTTIFFHSPKLNRQVWCESNLEWDCAILLDQNPSVLDYCEQSIELKWSKSTWVPDFVALVENNNEYHILILEIKYMQELLGKREHFVQKYDETREWIYQNMEIISNSMTNLPISQIHFIVVTELTLQQSFRFRNLRKLIQSKIEEQFSIDICASIQKVMFGVEQIPIESLANSIQALFKRNKPSKEKIYATIDTMIYNEDLFIDFEHLITPQSLVYGKSRDKLALDQWLKRFNWREQNFLHTPLIQHQDLYFIGRTPEKSIEYWKTASDRLETITPLLECSIKQLKEKRVIHDGKQISWKTAYRWILQYKEAAGDIRALIPKYTNCGRKKEFATDIAQNLWEYGRSQYLQLERKSIQLAFNHMQAHAYAQHHEDQCMSYSTFYLRIRGLNRKDVAKKRIGKRNAEKEFELTESEFPHGDFPLQSVQIDHTPIDVMIVDEENRQVTERPYLTVAFDSHTRCVLGYHITYNKPSRLSVAMTLLNCIQEKSTSIQKIYTQFPEMDEKLLTSINSSKWKDVYGLPFTLHMDNGSDFRSHDVRLFGARYKVHLHYRAVKKPQHGAYVERVLGTLNNRLHGIAGTTFSNTVEKKDYPSEKRAIYTLAELEARVLTEILLYHEDYHEQIRMAPIRKWDEAFQRTSAESAISRNLSQVNPEFFHLDVLPSEMRTVQKKGVQMFNLWYADPRIQKWIGTRDPEKYTEKLNFLIRYDPRDIRSIYFYDPDEQGYYPLRCSDRFVQTYYKDQTLTSWNWQAIKRNYKQDYHHSGSEFERKKRAFLLAQQSMDKEVAIRSKSVRIKRARQQNNEQQQQGFVETAGLYQEEQEPLQNWDFSKCTLPKDPDDVEYIYIPPEHENPFYGIQIDLKTNKITQRKHPHGKTDVL